MKLFIIKSVLLGCLCALMCGCGQKDPVLARIKNVKIKESEFIRQMNNSPAQYEGYLATDLGKQTYLGVLVNEEIIVQVARLEKLHQTPEIKAELKQARENYKQELNDYTNKLLIKKFLSTRREKELKVTDNEIEEYYNAHKDDYDNPREVIVKHILLDTEESAQEIFKKLYQGEKFEVLVAEVSLDSMTKEKGGTLSPFTQRSVMPEFKNVVFRLKDGEISGIIKSSFGYHIIQKVSEKKVPALSQKEIRNEIIKVIEKEKFIDLIESYKNILNVKIYNNYFSRNN